jgi:hypothetical protein
LLTEQSESTGVQDNLPVSKGPLTKQSESTGSKIRIISVGPGKGCHYKAGNVGGRYDLRVLWAVGTCALPHAGFLLGLLFNSGGNTFLKNAS